MIDPSREWKIRGGTLSLGSPLLMGILNLTPDSFSDGGELRTLDGALRRAGEMVEEGATILDVGGESTRPGAQRVPEAEEIDRVLPVVEALVKRFPVPVSIDTRKAAVARAALEAGASIVNDVSALSFDPDMARVAALSGAGVVLMHSRGTPAEMQAHTAYEDRVEVEVTKDLSEAVDRARAAGIAEAAIVLDPGIGFAKTAEQSLTLLARLDALSSLGFPLLVGPSRKSFLGAVTGAPPGDRIVGSAVACVMAYLRGAHIFRVHDVRAAAQALQLAGAIERDRAGWRTDEGAGRVR